ncbi:unnamed protein product [Somion occarium]|uniref:Uncharacterized protein n=1 Tax=Somion occarium TaxID=3059160 RepID=A0ABP1E9V4_9APHY
MPDFSYLGRSSPLSSIPVPKFNCLTGAKCLEWSKKSTSRWKSEAAEDTRTVSENLQRPKDHSSARLGRPKCTGHWRVIYKDGVETALTPTPYPLSSDVLSSYAGNILVSHTLNEKSPDTDPAWAFRYPFRQLWLWWSSVLSLSLEGRACARLSISIYVKHQGRCHDLTQCTIM